LIKSQLSKISEPIKGGLEEFNAIFKQSMKSNVGLVDLVTGFIIKQKGKKIRPLLVLLSAQICGGINQRTYRGAGLVELLHTATLVHDDVVDNADQRRGFPSINAIWKNKIAVLMGDYLLARGLLIAVEGKDFDFLGAITNTVKRMSEGELLQIQKTRKLDIDKVTYYKVISDKTASLLETCCHIGAMSASSNPDYLNSMRDFGNYLGMAFQITDDILDYEGTSSIIGKPVGGDIREKKITLPLILAMQKVSADEVSKIKKAIKEADKKGNVERVIEFVRTNGGIADARVTADEFIEKAKNCLGIFPDSDIKDSLTRLVDFVVKRKN
jgi:octaprenyl-diphosphate synthase